MFGAEKIISRRSDRKNLNSRKFRRKASKNPHIRPFGIQFGLDSSGQGTGWKTTTSWTQANTLGGRPIARGESAIGLG
ncbi:hypothetical protein BCCR75502_06048 [Burkholderia sola]|nr:hypothetical protein BCCR75389_06021 [Burkholderia cenocepacia]CAG2360192.1 hypothetical protein BCCR75388_06046 [Burkholderia cenocepacia]CAG2360215.1 hypothetical protein BCCR75387_06044 [Burkholderia cenocepacia]CAG2360216.1 hypothetical protein BCCR12632_06053 [Burkholderia cenocepacia]CAG2360230.1 hypothetical protein BCCR75384_06048 [Burkholderia cenocepacia]